MQIWGSFFRWINPQLHLRTDTLAPPATSGLALRSGYMRPTCWRRHRSWQLMLVGEACAPLSVVMATLLTQDTRSWPQRWWIRSYLDATFEFGPFYRRFLWPFQRLFRQHIRDVLVLQISVHIKGSICPLFNFSSHFPWCYPPLSFSHTWVQLAPAQPGPSPQVLTHVFVLKHQGGFINAAPLLFFCILLFLTIERLQGSELRLWVFCSLCSCNKHFTHHLIQGNLNEVMSLNTLNRTTWVNDHLLEPQILTLPPAGGHQRWLWLWPGRQRICPACFRRIPLSIIYRAAWSPKGF